MDFNFYPALFNIVSRGLVSVAMGAIVLAAYWFHPWREKSLDEIGAERSYRESYVESHDKAVSELGEVRSGVDERLRDLKDYRTCLETFRLYAQIAYDEIHEEVGSYARDLNEFDKHVNATKRTIALLPPSGEVNLENHERIQTRVKRLRSDIEESKEKLRAIGERDMNLRYALYGALREQEGVLRDALLREIYWELSKLAQRDHGNRFAPPRVNLDRIEASDSDLDERPSHAAFRKLLQDFAVLAAVVYGEYSIAERRRWLELLDAQREPESLEVVEKIRREVPKPDSSLLAVLEESTSNPEITSSTSRAAAMLDHVYVMDDEKGSVGISADASAPADTVFEVENASVRVDGSAPEPAELEGQTDDERESVEPFAVASAVTGTVSEVENPSVRAVSNVVDGDASERAEPEDTGIVNAALPEMWIYAGEIHGDTWYHRLLDVNEGPPVVEAEYVVIESVNVRNAPGGDGSIELPPLSKGARVIVKEVEIRKENYVWCRVDIAKLEGYSRD